jgi:hypothetical protein
MHPENCSTCSLASTATWQDFRDFILGQYLLYRAAGGDAFIGFWIPHTSQLADGHIYPNCPGEYSILLSVDDGESCLTIYNSEERICCSYIPWDLPWQRIELDDFPLSCDPDCVRDDEWAAVILAADLAVAELSKYGVSPVDAHFTTPDWVMHYEYSLVVG